MLPCVWMQQLDAILLDMYFHVFPCDAHKANQIDTAHYVLSRRNERELFPYRMVYETLKLLLLLYLFRYRRCVVVFSYCLATCSKAIRLLLCLLQPFVCYLLKVLVKSICFQPFVYHKTNGFSDLLMDSKNMITEAQAV